MSTFSLSDTTGVGAGRTASASRAAALRAFLRECGAGVAASLAWLAFGLSCLLWSDIGDWSEAIALFQLGRRTEAEALLRERGGGETRQARAAAVLTSFLAATGRTSEARDLIERASRGLIDHHVAYSIGVAYAQLGDHARAMTWLKRAIQTGFPCYPFFVSDPLLAPLRHDASFRALLHEVELKHAKWQRKYR